MLDDISTQDTVARLRAAAINSQIPQGVRARADRLAHRLEHGARIALLGPGGVGKSDLCTAILGAGDTAHESFETRAMRQQAANPEPATPGDNNTPHEVAQGPFGHAVVLDVSLPEATKEIDSADIVIWCTQSFSSEEAQLWTRASDALKDRSFLVLTKADLLAGAGVLQDRIAALQDTAAEEFHSFFPTTTQQISQLRRQGIRITDQHLASSGLKALIDAVAGIVASGHRADLDGALLFLERQGLTLNEPVVVPARAVQETETPQTSFQLAHDKLMAGAVELAASHLDDAEGDMSDILHLCGTICEELADVMRNMPQTDPEGDVWTPIFEDACDKVLLMATENDRRSAADAVTILLQLRRDLEQMSAR